MSSESWFVLGWRYTNKEGRFMLILGLISLLVIFCGAFLILIGTLSLFTIVGVPNPDIEGIFTLLFTGLGTCIVGVILMVIYSIGMKFVPPPVIPEPDDELDEQQTCC